MFCVKCGKPNEDSYIHCTACGSQLYSHKADGTVQEAMAANNMPEQVVVCGAPTSAADAFFSVFDKADSAIGKVFGLFAIIVGILLSLTGIGAIFGIPLIAAGCVLYFAGLGWCIITFIVLLFLLK